MNTKNIMMLAVFVMLASSVIVLSESEDSDAISVTWTQGTYVNTTLASGEEYLSISSGSVPGVTISVSNHNVVAVGTPSTAGNYTIGAVYQGDYGTSTMYIYITVTSSTTNYTVTFSAGSGGSVSPTSTSVESGTTYSTSGRYLVIGNTTVTATPNSGYSFSSWSSSSGTITSNKTITAYFSQNSYTCYLYYDANGGSGEPSTQTYTSSSTANHTFTIPSTIPTRSGYTFLGWALSNTATSPSYYPGGTFTVGYNDWELLYAVWAQNLTVTFSGGTGGTVSQNQITDVPYNSNINVSNNTVTINGTTVTATPNSGYSFSSWSNASGKVTANRTITATWNALDMGTQSNPLPSFSKSAKMTYESYNNETIYVAVGGSVQISYTQTSSGTDEYYATSVTSGYGLSITGYELSGTLTQATGNTPITVTIHSDTYPNSDHHLYIIAVNTSVSITVGQGGTTITLSSESTANWTVSNDKATLSSASGRSIVVTPVSNGNATVTATDPNNSNLHTSVTLYICTLTYNANGGTNAPTRQIYIDDVADGYHEFTISSSTPTRSGWSFLGWSTNSSATSPSYHPGDGFRSSTYDNTNLYAVWTQDMVVTPGAGGSTITLTSSVSCSWSITTNPTFASLSSASGTTTTVTPSNYGFIVVTATNDNNQQDIQQITLNMTRLVYDANGGTGAPATEYYISTSSGDHTFTLSSTAPTYEDHTFRGWGTTSTSSSIITSLNAEYRTSNTVYALWTGSEPTPDGDVYWSNDMFNGSVSILFKFPSGTSVTHVMEAPLYSGSVNEQQETTWTQNGYTLSVSTSYNGGRASVTATLLQGDTTVITGTKTIGNWYAFMVQLNPAEGKVTLLPVKTFNDFTSYEVMESMVSDVITWENPINSTLYTIGHKDTGTGTGPYFSVVNTMTFLNTFGVVLTNPSINVHDYFPQYEQVRVNLYAFAVYGDSMTINNKTWTVTDGQMTVYYTVDSDEQNIYATSDTEGAQSRTLTLSNIYITWDGTDCILTFDTDNFSVNLGHYSNGSETISFTGLWYFTISLYEPYTATQTQITGDWGNLMDIDKTALLLVFLGIILIAGLIAHMKLGLKWIDMSIVVIAMIVAFALLG